MPDTGHPFCSGCGRPLAAGATFCASCGRPVRAAGSDDRDATGGVIPYKNSSALIAYYCGVFSVLPCFPIGLAGLVLGIKGLRYANEHPASKGKVHAWIGIVAGGLFGILWLVVTGMIAVASMGR
jgi:zinc ribbon protein